MTSFWGDLGTLGVPGQRPGVSRLSHRIVPDQLPEPPPALFGSLGIIILAADTLINLYLAIIWHMGEPIGKRPLLTLGVLLMLVGLQFTSVGLLGEMVRHFTYQPEAEYSIRQTWL